MASISKENAAESLNRIREIMDRKDPAKHWHDMFVSGRRFFALFMVMAGIIIAGTAASLILIQDIPWQEQTQSMRNIVIGLWSVISVVLIIMRIILIQKLAKNMNKSMGEYLEIMTQQNADKAVLYIFLMGIILTVFLITIGKHLMILPIWYLASATILLLFFFLTHLHMFLRIGIALYVIGAAGAFFLLNPDFHALDWLTMAQRFFITLGLMGAALLLEGLVSGILNLINRKKERAAAKNQNQLADDYRAIREVLQSSYMCELMRRIVDIKLKQLIVAGVFVVLISIPCALFIGTPGTEQYELLYPRYKAVIIIAYLLSLVYIGAATIVNSIKSKPNNDEADIMQLLMSSIYGNLVGTAVPLLIMMIILSFMLKDTWQFILPEIILSFGFMMLIMNTRLQHAGINTFSFVWVIAGTILLFVPVYNVFWILAGIGISLILWGLTGQIARRQTGKDDGNAKAS